MSDLREQVARAIYEQSNIAPETYDDTTPNRREYFGRSADAAIPVVIEELAQRAESSGWAWANSDVADWLRSQQEHQEKNDGQS